MRCYHIKDIQRDILDFSVGKAVFELPMVRMIYGTCIFPTLQDHRINTFNSDKLNPV